MRWPDLAICHFVAGLNPNIWRTSTTSHSPHFRNLYDRTTVQNIKSVGKTNKENATCHDQVRM